MADRRRWAVLRRPLPPPYDPDPDLITGIESAQRPPSQAPAPPEPAPEPEYTDAEIAEMWRAYKTARCPFCGGAHRRECPRVKSITRYPNGGINRITYFADWDDANVLWPEDIPGPDPEPEAAP